MIVDLRNIYRPDEMKRANFRYLAIGRAGVELARHSAPKGANPNP